ncbi:UNKNOWN [Stylonychia lemnae]|uniref:Uncharacterized protein n=1 Tax=Stylonychia lemnae TaxID=5949 RepID=A0A078A5A5_STYLE|nr:UNKNOWN [Stylonychia lemnae]|eukprot:CDW76765.1 UNKNOWN [Stylonychia lemnae]
MKDEQEQKNALYMKMDFVKTMNHSKNLSLDSQNSFSNINFDDVLKVEKQTNGIQQTNEKVMDLRKGRKSLQLIKSLIFAKPQEKTKVKFNQSKKQVSTYDSFPSVQKKLKELEELNRPRKVDINNTTKNWGKFTKSEKNR